MTRRRFFAAVKAFNFKQQTVVLGSDEARHLNDVLRLRVGDECFVFDGTGKEFRCLVAVQSRDVTQLDILEKMDPPSSESPLSITLAVALLKGEKFDLVVQKATELGVTEIVPVSTRHADIQLRDKGDAAKRVMRWQRIALEAAKQSGRAVVPVVAEPKDLGVLIETAKPSFRIMFSEKSGSQLNSISTVASADNSVLVLVGPEGGWADEEVALALESNWQVVTLGGRTLRAETAAIVAVTLVQHRFGDLK
jgi:16S rRNA (uracil1498-N3)-methyltransferase